ncbi:MAG: hypothetical protein HY704_04050, partial [Gemmatimonadetes bacterium]|nr:hypothetical protein [Gemmatimonadota bacterium]
MVEEGVHAGPGHEGGELLDQLVRLEQDRPRAVVPHAAQGKKDLSVGSDLERILRHRRAQHVAREVLEAAAVARGHGDVGVQVKAPDMSLTLPAERHQRSAAVPA